MSDKSEYFAEIVDSADAAVEGGAVVSSMPLRFALQQAPAPAHEGINNWGRFRGAVLAIAFPTETESNVFGSAVMVAPGIALGALHVFKEAHDAVMSSAAGALCYGLDGDEVRVWRIRHVTGAGGETPSDLALYSLALSSALPASGEFAQAVISTRTPAIGERLTIVGFRQGDSMTHREVGSPCVRVAMGMYVSSGLVTEQWPQRRDGAMLPFPCVQVDCHTLGGMSGGPAFDDKGRLVGILTSSLDGGPSFVSLLWPALSWRPPGGWPRFLMREAQSLLAIESPRCEIEGREALVPIPNSTKVEYLPWS